MLPVFLYAFYLYGDQKLTYPAHPRQRSFCLLGASRVRYWASSMALVRRLLATSKRVHIVLPVSRTAGAD